MIPPLANSYLATAARPGAAPPPRDTPEPLEETTAVTRVADVETEADPAVQREIARLALRDREVRAHEQAHLAAGGSLITSGPSYSFTTGPDNRRYATGGEVGIDSSPVRGDPEATIVKARQIRAAALAPAQPSGADRAVAAKANSLEQQARLELALQQREQAYNSAANDSTSERRGLLQEVA